MMTRACGHRSWRILISHRLAGDGYSSGHLRLVVDEQKLAALIAGAILRSKHGRHRRHTEVCLATLTCLSNSNLIGGHWIIQGRPLSLLHFGLDILDSLQARTVRDVRSVGNSSRSIPRSKFEVVIHCAAAHMQCGSVNTLEMRRQQMCRRNNP